MAAKPFTDKANANAQAIQAATDYLTAQLQAKSRLQQAHTKIAGQLQDAHLDAKGQAAEAAMKAQHAQGQPTTPPEDVVGPQIQGVPLPQVGQASQNIPGQTLSIDPSQVSGGGGIQQASGINGGGGGADATGGYNVPPTITSQSQTQGTNWQQTAPGNFIGLPQDQTSTHTTQNVMTPFQAASLQQNERNMARHAAIEQQQLNIAERSANTSAAMGLIREFGASAAPLAGAAAAGAPLTPEMFQKAGKTLSQLQTEASVNASNQQTSYYKSKIGWDSDANKRANKLFDLQRVEIIARIAQTGQQVTTSTLPLNNALGPTKSQLGAQDPNQLQANMASWGAAHSEGLKSSVDTGASDFDNPMKYFLEVGAPAGAQNQIVVQDQRPQGVIDALTGQKTAVGLTAVPLETFLAEFELAKGRVPVATNDRVAEAKQRLKEWGYFDAGKETGATGYMKYYWDRVRGAMEEYRNTAVEQDALSSLGMTSVKGAEQLRPTPAERNTQRTLDLNRERQKGQLLKNLKLYDELRKSLSESQGGAGPQ